jgi:type IV secretory pathway TrbD component
VSSARWLGGACRPEDRGGAGAGLVAGATGVVSGGWLAATGLALWQAAVENNTAKPKQAKVAFIICFGPLRAFLIETELLPTI